MPSTPGKPLAVVLEPAKDLAEQVYNEVDRLKKYVLAPPVSQVLVMGGRDTAKIAKRVQKDHDIVVGTPGMIASFIRVCFVSVPFRHRKRLWMTPLMLGVNRQGNWTFQACGFLYWTRPTSFVMKTTCLPSCKSTKPFPRCASAPLCLHGTIAHPLCVRHVSGAWFEGRVQAPGLFLFRYSAFPPNHEPVQGNLPPPHLG